MSKKITNLTLLSLFIFLVIASIFYACKKEDQIVDNPPIYKTHGYYDQLSLETNVNILELASSHELRQYLDETFLTTAYACSAAMSYFAYVACREENNCD